MRVPTAILVVVAGAGGGCRPGPANPSPALGEPRLAWVFEAPRPGTVLATPAVTPDAIYLAAAHPRGIDYTGAVYALDPATGKVRWTFDRDGTMLPSASPPLAAGGRLFVGEGMHGHFACRLQCLDAASGRPVWDRPVGDHIEGGPVAADDLVLFSAGNDGLYAVDRATGAVKWNFRADLHIDSTPAVVSGRAFVGSGTSRRFQNYQVVCLNVSSGKPIWRTPVTLPAWGNPLVDRDRVYVGLGNGRLTESARPPEKPAGALVCLDAATGQHMWTCPVGDAVFGRPAAGGGRIVFGSRDGNVYGVGPDGREAYRMPMGGPVVAGVEAAGGRVYAASVAGRVVCLDGVTGTEKWRHDLDRTGVEPHVFAAPVVVGGRLYVAAEMTAGETGVVSLFAFDLPPGDGGGP
jgi:outer membrane protein assembly factor BamB